MFNNLSFICCKLGCSRFGWSFQYPIYGLMLTIWFCTIHYHKNGQYLPFWMVSIDDKDTLVWWLWGNSNPLGQLQQWVSNPILRPNLSPTQKNLDPSLEIDSNTISNSVLFRVQTHYESAGQAPHIVPTSGGGEKALKACVLHIRGREWREAPEAPTRESSPKHSHRHMGPMPCHTPKVTQLPHEINGQDQSILKWTVLV